MKQRPAPGNGAASRGFGDNMTEYKVTVSSGLPTQEQLNELAHDGWDLVQVVPNVASRDKFEYAVYLRRPMTKQ